MSEISIVVPVYNTQAYLPECIQSILSQTFSDFELLLIDDGSVDESGRICDGYQAKDPRVRVVHTPNAGQSAARNLGTAEARSDLLCFIDSDDVVHPTLLQVFYETARARNVGAVACGRVCGETPPEGFRSAQTGETEILSIDETCLLRMLEEDETAYWTLFPCLIKKEIVQKHPLTPGRVMEDNAVSCRWLCEAGRVALVRQPLYFYRENPNGTMNAAFSPKKLDYLWALEEQLSFYETRGFQRMQGAVAKIYVNNALWLASRVKNELGNETLARDVIRKAVRIRDRYAAFAGFTEEEERKLFKAAHPILHRARKKIGSVFGPKKKTLEG